MKGLLIKDFKLLKAQGKFIAIILVLCVLFLARGQEMFYVFTYASAILTMLAAATITYDQTDNGMGFIFTFPVSREKYVLAKYTFGMLLAVCLTAAFLAGMLAAGTVSSAPYRAQEYFTGVSGILLAAIVSMSAMIPLQLKFGAEKSRIVMLTILGFIGLAVYVARQAAEALHIDLTPLIDWIWQAGPMETAVCIGVLAAGMLVISYMVSVAVMRRKQF